MPEFLQLCSVEEAWDRWAGPLAPAMPLPRSQRLPTERALGRVLSSDVLAPEPLPPFRRSTVDGFAVRARDTFGAQPSLPAYLKLAGEVPMGASADLTLGELQAAVVHTGGMLPAQADAVVMLEDTQRSQPDEIEVMRPVAEGENVLQAGEDLSAGDLALPAGLALRAPDVGGLHALGITHVEVRDRPRVALISTGDEVVAPEDSPQAGQVRDVNSGMLAGLVEAAGGQPDPVGIIPDDAAALLAAAKRALEQADALVISAGSSVSARDMTADVINELGEPGVLVHGVAIKPGKPTILGVCDGKAVLGLPGNPVSAYVVARLFLVPLIRRLLGAPADTPQAAVTANIRTRVASQSGREDFLPVRLVPAEGGWLAEPVYGRSNLIFTLSRADGWVRIPAEATGLERGDRVSVELLR